jgi:hypothetical protein
MAKRAEQAAAQKLADMRKLATQKAAAAPLSTQTGAPTPPKNSMTDEEVARAAIAEYLGSSN